MNFLMYSEPWDLKYSGGYANQDIIVSKEDAIRMQKNVAFAHGCLYPDDETALLDFIAVNWAVECDDPRKLLPTPTNKENPTT